MIALGKRITRLVRLLAIAVLVGLAQPSATPPVHAQSVTQSVSLAYAYPYSYVVLFWNGTEANACAYRANPRVLLYCSSDSYPNVGIVIFQPLDPNPLMRPIAGTVITLESSTSGAILYTGVIPEDRRTIILPLVQN